MACHALGTALFGPQADEVGEQGELVVFEQQQQLLDRRRDLGVERPVPVALPQCRVDQLGDFVELAPRERVRGLAQRHPDGAERQERGFGGPLQHREQLVDGGEVADVVLRP